jgi:hypothetical protein
MKAALLDVNVLIALIDPSHELHDAAHEWWATCPITENACVRILAQPGYPYLGLGVQEIRGMLAEFFSDADHRFWAGSISVLDGERFDLSGVTPKQLTDVYLLGVAVAQGGRLATFDRGVRLGSVTGAGLRSVVVIRERLE